MHPFYLCRSSKTGSRTSYEMQLLQTDKDIQKCNHILANHLHPQTNFTIFAA